MVVRPVWKLELKTGKKLQYYPTLAAANATFEKLPSDPSIMNCCKGKLKSAHGYFWSYATPEEIIEHDGNSDNVYPFDALKPRPRFNRVANPSIAPTWQKYGFKNKCQVCGWKMGTCDVHHIKQRIDGGTDDPSNLIVLCPNCHAMIHRHKFTIPELRGMIRSD